MMPQWQCYPAIPTIDFPYNWDWLSAENPGAAYAALSNGQAVISFAYMLLDP
jgi:hypothetical protein